MTAGRTVATPRQAYWRASLFNRVDLVTVALSVAGAAHEVALEYGGGGGYGSGGGNSSTSGSVVVGGGSISSSSSSSSMSNIEVTGHVSNVLRLVRLVRLARVLRVARLQVGQPRQGGAGW